MSANSMGKRTYDIRVLRLCEKLPLLIANRHPQFFHHHHHIFPNSAFFRESLVSQHVRGMVSGHQGSSAIGLPIPAQFHDADRLSEQPLNGGSSKGDENLWPNQID